jgi:hypothetical protein
LTNEAIIVLYTVLCRCSQNGYQLTVTVTGTPISIVSILGADAAGYSRTITLFCVCVAVFENKEKMLLVIPEK